MSRPHRHRRPPDLDRVRLVASERFPRGACRDSFTATFIFELGNLHFGRKRVQPAGLEIREFYETASGKLMFSAS